MKLRLCNFCNPLCHLCTSRNLDTFKAWKSDFATFCNLCNLHNTNICFHNITQMRPLILTCHGHLFKTCKLDLQLLHPFQTLQPWYANPQKLGRRTKWHLLLMYQSIPSLTTPGHFFDVQIPHPPGKKGVQNPTPGPIKTS